MKTPRRPTRPPQTQAASNAAAASAAAAAARSPATTSCLRHGALADTDDCAWTPHEERADSLWMEVER